MPHADSSLVPEHIETKAEFYAHVQESLKSLLEGHRYWVTNLVQTASVLYHSYMSSKLYGGTHHKPVVNWAGFYLHPPTPSHFHHPPPVDPTDPTATPIPNTSAPATSTSTSTDATPAPKPLLLGPYQGRPACLSISLSSPTPGVCATSFLSRSTVIVPDVEKQPGHIACDAETKSEIVLPLGEIGVLDLDSTELATFDRDDQQGLESIVAMLLEMTDFV